MEKYTDDEIRVMSKITCKIAGDYLGISPMAVSIGMRNNLLLIGFAIEMWRIPCRQIIRSVIDGFQKVGHIILLGKG